MACHQINFHRCIVESILALWNTTWYNSREMHEAVTWWTQSDPSEALPFPPSKAFTKVLSQSSGIFHQDSLPFGPIPFSMLLLDRRYKSLNAYINRIRNSYFPQTFSFWTGLHKQSQSYLGNGTLWTTSITTIGWFSIVFCTIFPLSREFMYHLCFHVVQIYMLVMLRQARYLLYLCIYMTINVTCHFPPSHFQYTFFTSQMPLSLCDYMLL